jgi:predicted small secreted protein
MRRASPVSGHGFASLTDMRIAVLIAASVLVGGCSQGVGRDAEQTTPSLSAPARSTASTPRTTTPTTTIPARPPEPGAPIADVIRFVEAGQPADVAQFHTATREGAATQLGDDVAFTTPSGKSQCMTDSKNFGGALACLVDLTIPPLQPPDVYGQWKGGWVDFAGPSVEIGSVHGDPGRFAAGTGPQLPYGQSLAFSDYRCRSDEVGLYCVNYANQSAARFSDAGIVAFGCLQKVTPPAGVGEKYSC